MFEILRVSCITVNWDIFMTRVATVREKYLENENEKSGNFVDGQGNLERTLKVREFC